MEEEREGWREKENEWRREVEEVRGSMGEKVESTERIYKAQIEELISKNYQSISNKNIQVA